MSAAYSPRPEDDLVARACAGDGCAFGELYDLHAQRVYRHVYYRIGNRVEAEDLTQQTFMNAWRALDRYRRTEAPFVAWLLTIAHNLVVSHLRSKRPQTAELAEGFAWVDEGADPHEEAVSRFHQAAVRRALRQLKPEQQEIITLRYLEDVEYEDIAAATGKNVNNVRVILHRGLQRMRALLEDVHA